MFVAGSTDEPVQQEDQILAMIRRLNQPIDYIGSRFSSDALEEVLSPDALISAETGDSVSVYEELRLLLGAELGEDTSEAVVKKPKKKAKKKKKLAQPAELSESAEVPKPAKETEKVKPLKKVSKKRAGGSSKKVLKGERKKVPKPVPDSSS